MPKMSEVITNVTNYITANPASTGQAIIDGTNHKRHQVKQAIGSLVESNTISAPTSAFVTRVYRKPEGKITSNIFGTGKIFVAPMTIVSDQGGTIEISHVMIDVITANGNIRVKVYDDTSGEPSTLLGQSNSTAISSGLLVVPLISNATIPADGKIWVGFETDSLTANFTASIETTGKQKNVVHNYGTGSNPFNEMTVENPDGDTFNNNIVPMVSVRTTENKVPRWYTAQYTIV